MAGSVLLTINQVIIRDSVIGAEKFVGLGVLMQLSPRKANAM